MRALIALTGALLLPISIGLAAPAYVIAVHGGAGSSPKDFSAEQNAARRAGITTALRAGETVLKAGGSALDAVEASIRSLEDNPLFNAGRGAVLNAAGAAELDASIMDGSTKACGAVAGTTVSKHPISVARAVMSKTRHVLLAAEGADAFAREIGAELTENGSFITEPQRARWKRAKEKAQKKLDASAGDGAATGATDDLSERIGTVGCVALDAQGNLAAGTSTGGLMMKKFGRVGDSPIVGAGTYADNTTCAVSCTGVGEEFIRNAIAYDIHARIKYAEADLEAAVKAQLEEVLEPGYGGIIALGADGSIVMEYNTGGMACGVADSEGRF
ncbi:MAG: isoaspartyl peptidase/L-asparaginase family protein [Verrucomicrobiales bacterium]